MEKKEQIERLKKEIKDYKRFRKSLGTQACVGKSLLEYHDKQIAELEQELKELENTVLTCDEVQELTPEEYKRQTEKGND